MKKIILSFSLMIAGTMLTSAGTGIQENTDRLSDEEKIYGLSTVWKEADKNFVFFDQVPDLDWNKTYQTFIPKVLKTQTTYEYYRILQEFCSLLNDGHTQVVIPWVTCLEAMEVLYRCSSSRYQREGPLQSPTLISSDIL